MSIMKFETRKNLVKQFVRMEMIESRRVLDNAEFWCVVTLVLHLTNEKLESNRGVQLETQTVYPQLNAIQRFNACYVSAHQINHIYIPVVPNSVIEHMMLGEFSTASFINRPL